MKDIEFHKIGKRIPYQAPDGFFDQVSEYTLQKAKLRHEIHRKNLILWRTMAVAATLAAIIFIGYFQFQPQQADDQLMVQQKQRPQEPVQEQKSDLEKAPLAVAVKEDSSLKMKSKVKNNTEDMTAVLADMTDEELLQMAAYYNSDPFIEEAVQ